MAVSHPSPASLPAAASGNSQPLVPQLGMRRVQWVRISVSDGGVRAEVAGIAHRFPVIRPVPLHLANTLIRAGCPYVVRRDRRSPAGN